MKELIGRNLGPYRIVEPIGAGGMATVYKAYQPAMDRYVAIKVLPQHLAHDPNFRARFQREARTIARLEHRYILPTHDVSEDDGIPYLVMRYTDGGTLSDLIASGKLSIERAVQIVGQVAEALEYAHQQGVIHRDIKPANVLIGRDGGVLLSDFGIAKIYAETLQLTGEGAIVGTPAYMAPEQFEGKPVDPRTDIYALGVLLYQALTGECPFVAETPLAVALMHIHNPLRPPRQLNPAIPEPLERVVFRAMAKNPADRFQTAAEMERALRGALAAPPDLPLAPDMNTRAGAIPPAQSTVQLAPAIDAGPSTLPPAPIQSQPAATLSRPRLGGARLWLAAGGALALVALVALIVWLRPSRQAPAASALPSSLPASGQPMPAAASMISDLAVGPDAVWAATDGGLVRWSADGASRVFTAADGLPFEELNAVIVARDGTLWVGGGGVAHIRPTADGLRVVGSYTKDDGLGAGVIRALMLDTDGSIWAGGPQQPNRFPLSHFDGSAWRTDELPTDDPAFQGVDLVIQSLMRDREGSLWLGLRRDGLLRWDGSRWTHYGPDQGVAPGDTSDSDVRIRRLLQSDDGTIWAAGSERGLLRFDARQGRWERVAIVSDDTSIRAIAQFGGELWVGGDGMVARSADGGRTWAEVGAGGLGTDIGSLVRDSAGRAWAGAYNGGAYLFDGSTWRQLQR